MSIQVAILKVLVSYPDGRATLDEMKRDLAILTSSGRDWSDLLRHLAARAPGLDIFAQKLVARDEAGWTITAAGRDRLEQIQNPSYETISEVAATAEPERVSVEQDEPVQRPPKVITFSNQTPRRRRRSRGPSTRSIAR